MAYDKRWYLTVLVTCPHCHNKVTAEKYIVHEEQCRNFPSSRPDPPAIWTEHMLLRNHVGIVDQDELILSDLQDREFSQENNRMFVLMDAIVKLAKESGLDPVRQRAAVHATDLVMASLLAEPLIDGDRLEGIVLRSILADLAGAGLLDPIHC